MFFKKKNQKQDVKEIQNQVKDHIASVKSQAEPAVADVVDKADKIKDEVKDVAEEQVEYLSNHIKAKPIKAIVISTVVGYLLGRITR